MFGCKCETFSSNQVFVHVIAHMDGIALGSDMTIKKKKINCPSVSMNLLNLASSEINDLCKEVDH